MSGEVDAARRAFPRGLFQPSGSYRFAADSLALAAFGRRFLPEGKVRFADLGTGCGVVGLALLLGSPADLSGFGVEREGVLAAAAWRNADKLGFSERFRVVECDVAEVCSKGDIPSDDLDLVLANPPWRLHGSCRLSASALRNAALVGDERTFPSFAQAAFFLLKPGGWFACAVCRDREQALYDAASGAGFACIERRIPLLDGIAPAPFALLGFLKDG